MRAIHRGGRLRAAFWLLCLLTLALAGAVFWLSRQGETQPMGYLKDDGGHLAYYQAGAQEPTRRYDVLTRLLPESDTEDLLAGVAVYSDSDLARLVEDYGG